MPTSRRPPSPPLWHDLTSPELGRFAASDPVVVLPLAAIEQHGPHLPLSTDLEIGLGLIGEAFRGLDPELPVRVLPPLAVGTSPEHDGMPGTLSLSGDLLEDTLVQIGAGVARTGVRRLLVSNSHGGNQGVLERAALRLRNDHGMLVVKLYYARLPRPDPPPFPDTEWRHGLHGGAVETSMMLHLRPELVQMDRAAPERSLGEELEASGSRIGPQGTVPFAWRAGDLNSSGVTGDPTLATPEAGALLVAHYGAALADVIRDARRFPLDRLE
ncbi:MAG: creatininase family protein [Gemmatimonadales bacterium]|nr:MAG: creatininase family protein [Gemmatimonadales bacterium]